MESAVITTIVTAILEGGGLAALFYYVVKGLRRHISALKDTIDTQKTTLDTMERRIVETEKIGNLYKAMVESLPKDLENFRTIMSKLKDETIGELQRAINDKNEELKISKESSLKAIEDQESVVDRIRKMVSSVSESSEKVILPSIGKQLTEQIPEFLVGTWNHKYFDRDRKIMVPERATIDEKGLYYVNEEKEPKFRLAKFNLEWGKGIITFDKRDAHTGKTHSRERLHVSPDGMFLAGEAKGEKKDKREYRRID